MLQLQFQVQYPGHEGNTTFSSSPSPSSSSSSSERRFDMLPVHSQVWMAEYPVQSPHFSISIAVGKTWSTEAQPGHRIHVYCRRQVTGEEAVHYASLSTATPEAVFSPRFEMPPPQFAIQIIALVVPNDSVIGSNGNATSGPAFRVPVHDMHDRYCASYMRNKEWLTKQNVHQKQHYGRTEA
eukprot:ANDGO_04393.mRNA.1 hypothetical protein